MRDYRPIVPVLCGAAVAVLWLGSRHQQTATVGLINRLGRERTVQHDPTLPGDTEGLPAPVQRYLRWALRAPKRVRQVRLEQKGTLRTDVLGDRWMAFEAQHTVVPPANGFVWDARVSIAPLLHVRVRDAFVDGRGSGEVSFLSAIPVGGAADTPEMNSGSLHRYLAEAVWYPTALLPSAALRWTPIDGSRALATLTVRDVSVSLEFGFSERGEVTSIYTPGRWGTFPEGYRQVPWGGHFRDYKEWNGFVIPTGGDVGWYVDGEWRTVWKGTITAFDVVD